MSYKAMNSWARNARVFSIWSLLAVVLLLSAVAFIEQLAPALETQTQDEQALAEFASALKTDAVVLASAPARVVRLVIAAASPGVPLCSRTHRPERGCSLFAPSSLRLHQELSVYRI